MLSIRRVLWPTDFSQGADRAFPHAAALASWHDAELHVLHVTEDQGTEASDVDVPISESTLSGLLSADGDPPPHVDLGALPLVQEQREHDSPSEAIVGYTEEHEIDLIVAGTHGRRGLQRMLIGSVAEEVLRTAPCPVLTVRGEHNNTPAWAVRNILVPVDFSDASLEALRHAKELALTYGAQITLLHAVEEVVYPSAYGVEPANLPGPQVIDRVEESLAELARTEIGYEHVVVQANVGYAPSTILDYAETNEVDLVVIATHGRTGLERMLLGSVAERVVRRAPAPVFTVKSFGKSLLPDADAS
ncbi:MAG: universal stress protein [Salinibacter sp.]|jgi:Universal stress protein UspA and related nucleotide-binding proteins|uniref:universal stress protein n=1 Tax=Salinibacter sp. TaxID=2065818 RepID=UPI002FC315C1